MCVYTFSCSQQREFRQKLNRVFSIAPRLDKKVYIGTLILLSNDIIDSIVPLPQFGATVSSIFGRLAGIFRHGRGSNQSCLVLHGGSHRLIFLP